MKRHVTLKLHALLALLCYFTATTAAPVEDTNLEFIVLHNNDIHARFEETDKYSNKCSEKDAANKICYGGIARTAHEIRRFREEAKKPGGTPVIYLNAGDSYSGTVWFTIFKDKITSEMMNILAPEAMCLGNHEFDSGTKGLIPFLNAVNFPVVTANLGLERSPKLRAAKNLQNSTVILIKGTKVGIVGYLTPDTKRMASADDVDIYPEIEYVNEETKRLKDAGVNVIIGLGHSGHETDKKIAANCPDLDLVIGGHTNTFLYTGDAPDYEKPEGRYPVVVEQPSGKRVPVVQAYAYTKYLGNIKLKFNGNGDLLEWRGNPILLDSSIPQDDDVLKALDVYRPNISSIEDSVIGKTDIRLDGTKIACRKSECSMGNVMADSMVYARQKEIKKSSRGQKQNDAVIAFVQAGGIRASIERKEDGAITHNDVLNVLPFNNTLYVISIPGSVIRSALELSAEIYDRNDLNGGFLQMAGVRATFDVSKPLGQRVTTILVRCAECNSVQYDELDDSKMYKVILSSFLLKGGDGHKWTDARKPFEVAERMGATDYQAALDFIKDNSPIKSDTISRITIVKEE